MKPKGYNLVEISLILFFLGILMILAIPAMGRKLKTGRLQSASRHMLVLMNQTRTYAAMRGCYAALRFFKVSGAYHHCIYEDGNGNGVRESDIRNGIDKPLTLPEKIGARFPGVEIRIVDSARISSIPPAGGYLNNHDDPVKFGNSDLISFSPLGSSSSGTLYLSSGQVEMTGLKVFGPTVRTQIWSYMYAADKWRRLK